MITKHTLRVALRNAVVNETVNSLTQAICAQCNKGGGQSTGSSSGSFSLIAFADAELFYGRDSIQLLAKEAERRLAIDLGDDPYHRFARVSDWVRGELEASYHFLEQAATPLPPSVGLTASSDPLEELGDRIASRDFSRIAQMRVSPHRMMLVCSERVGKPFWRRTTWANTARESRTSSPSP